MPAFNRWTQGEEFLASSAAFPGVYGEGDTREEAIENFWQMVDFTGELARAPDWPHDRSPYVDEWETLGDDEVEAGAEDDLPPWKGEEDDDDLPPWSGEPWKAE